MTKGGFGKIQNTVKYLDYSNIAKGLEVITKNSQEITEKDLFEQSERKRLGLSNPTFFDADNNRIYSKYEQLAEEYISTGRKVPDKLEKLLIETANERQNNKVNSKDSIITDEYIKEKYGIDI